MGITINCAHINHNLRDTAKRDEDFVRLICEKNKIPFYLYNTDIKKISNETGQSEETSGRNERYKFFFEVLKKTNSSIILTAHNKEDNAETVLMNLLRGSGANGMRGITPIRADGVGRPLLDISRVEIEDYLNINDIAYMEDETNNDDKYKRNFIRLNVFPLLKEYNSSATDLIVRAAKSISCDDDLILDMAKKADGIKISDESVIISKKTLNDNPIPVAKRIIMVALKKAEIKASLPDIEAVLLLANMHTGKKHVFSSQKIAYCSYENIIIETPVKEQDYSYKLIPEKEVYIKEIGKNILLTRQKPDNIYLKIKFVDGNFEVRSKRDGDKFSPYNLNGTKKLKDFFIDKKIPSSVRWKIPVITCNGNIAAVGDRVDNNFFAKEDSLALFLIIR